MDGTAMIFTIRWNYFSNRKLAVDHRQCCFHDVVRRGPALTNYISHSIRSGTAVCLDPLMGRTLQPS